MSYWLWSVVRVYFSSIITTICLWADDSGIDFSRRTTKQVWKSNKNIVFPACIQGKFDGRYLHLVSRWPSMETEVKPRHLARTHTTIPGWLPISKVNIDFAKIRFGGVMMSHCHTADIKLTYITRRIKTGHGSLSLLLELMPTVRATSAVSKYLDF